MDKSILIGIISFVAVFVSFILSVFLLTVKTENKLSNVLFASFIILSGIDLSGFFIYYFIHDHPDLEMFRHQISFLIMPFFYLYVLSVCYSDFKLKPKHLIHVVPFIIGNLVVLPRFYMADRAGKMHYLSNFLDNPETIFTGIFIDLQFFFYIIAVFITLRKFKRIYLENYTDPTIITYKWLFQLTTLSVVAHSLVMLKNILLYTKSVNISLWANLFVGVSALSVLCWFVLKALHYPELFRGVDSKLQLVKDIIPVVESAKEQSFSPIEGGDEINTRIKELKEFMLRNEPFLEPSLTIQDLAAQIKMPVRDLSVLINHYQDQHFFDFVNEYRIRKAMEVLKDPLKNDLNIQEILYSVGFNSKSSFNTAFKKYTNLTPTQYRSGSILERY